MGVKGDDNDASTQKKRKRAESEEADVTATNTEESVGKPLNPLSSFEEALDALQLPSDVMSELIAPNLETLQNIWQAQPGNGVVRVCNPSLDRTQFLVFAAAMMAYRGFRVLYLTRAVYWAYQAQRFCNHATRMMGIYETAKIQCLTPVVVVDCSEYDVVLLHCLEMYERKENGYGLENTENCRVISQPAKEYDDGWIHTTFGGCHCDND
ncbi:Hypothetical protein UVM_LOCUS466 [uncultured virus]|nr:Hypothetical protein UVM_LOCUS466 [uncultured virus]